MARTTQTPRTTQLQVRLTEDEAGWLRAHAEERRTTVSGVVVGWIEDARRREMDSGTLKDYETGEEIREATAEEREASVEAARRDGGAGVILVDGRRCYVED